jgi:hypothetical protein
MVFLKGRSNKGPGLLRKPQSPARRQEAAGSPGWRDQIRRWIERKQTSCLRSSGGWDAKENSEALGRERDTVETAGTGKYCSRFAGARTVTAAWREKLSAAAN